MNDKEETSKEKKTPKKDKAGKGLQSPKHEKQTNNEKTLNAEKASKSEKTPKSNYASPNENKKGEKSPKTQLNITPQKQTLEGGVFIEDLSVGSGPEAESGKFVSVYYVGCLESNGKQFDALKKGSGFTFCLGKGEVISGWDIGVSGMRAGGKRRITCPPDAAYGSEGAPPSIPPNSTLVFEVELKHVFI